jgi:peptide/nickel transport system permease protein
LAARLGSVALAVLGVGTLVFLLIHMVPGDTETVFAWPELGSLLVEAIQQRDYPVVQGAVLLISLAYVIVNSATDLAYGLAGPPRPSGLIRRASCYSE